MTILTFQQALDASSHFSKRHLLLGNGFSIACRPDIFRYDKLLEQADFSNLPETLREAFNTLNTVDFERVIKALRDAASLIKLYSHDESIQHIIISDADLLKELLVQTIASSHPAYPGEISNAEYSACQQFLSYFNTTYTLNYDLLLYWTRMHQDEDAQILSDDGFRTSSADIELETISDYVVWESGNSYKQNLWFLHGALHIFDSGTEVQKYTWNRTGVRLIEQIRDALSRDLFPLFVAEGSSEEKLEHIRHSDYLAKAYRSFQEIQHCLFIYGHSLAENDEHYLKLIQNGKLSHLYVGLYGDPDSIANRHIIRRTNAMSAARSYKRPLAIDFYDSDTANVWG